MNLMSRFFLVVLFLAALFSVTSCKEDIDFSTNPTDKLVFSSDTVRFDTVFTVMGSSTRQIRIYNHSSKALKIESVEIASGKNFSVVLDGFRLNKLNNSSEGIRRDVEIGANDSLFVFVEVKINPQDKNSPIFVNDSLVFRTNGNVQRVRLEAYGQDVKILRGRTFTSDTTLTGERPFLVYDSLIVAKGAKLTLQPNVRLFFHDQSFCRIDGQISSKGSMSQPVVFRGDRMDYLLPDLPFDLYTGQWGGVSISTDSYENEMEFTHIRNGQYALQLDSSTVDKQKIRLVNCVFKNVNGIVLNAFNCDVEAIGCEFSNGGADVVRALGGSYMFTHCTLNNAFPFGGFSSPTALHLINYKLISTKKPITWKNHPLNQATFNNCIIYGNKFTEITFDNKPNGYVVTDVPFKFRFDFCLIKANGEDDNDFIQTVWDKDPKFLNVNKDDKFIYDLRLDSLSAAVDKANLANVVKSPIDMNGISRLADQGPDIGAYERVKVKGK
ncbi:MAG: hypothetical protein ACOYOT_12250 [Bacteroidales bacterium]